MHITIMFKHFLQNRLANQNQNVIMWSINGLVKWKIFRCLGNVCCVSILYICGMFTCKLAKNVQSVQKETPTLQNILEHF